MSLEPFFIFTLEVFSQKINHRGIRMYQKLKFNQHIEHMIKKMKEQIRFLEKLISKKEL